MSTRRLMSVAIRAGIVIILAAFFLLHRTDSALSTPATNVPLVTAATSTYPTDSTWYPVTKVVDGDTIKINKDGAIITIRLIGVDTPETVDPRKPVQCFGEAASNETKQLLTGQSVRIELDPSQGTLDKYGRTLAYVYAPSNSNAAGILVDEYLIAEGYGHEYTYDTPYKYQTEFKAAEAAARTQKKGLWADGACAATSTQQ